MAIMAQSAANLRDTCAHVDRTYSLTHSLTHLRICSSQLVQAKETQPQTEVELLKSGLTSVRGAAS